MKSYEVIDNLLPKEDFKRLQEILPKQVPFYIQKTINGFHSESEKDTIWEIYKLVEDR